MIFLGFPVAVVALRVFLFMSKLNRCCVIYSVHYILLFVLMWFCIVIRIDFDVDVVVMTAGESSFPRTASRSTRCTCALTAATGWWWTG